MSEKFTDRVSATDDRQSQTDWVRLAAMTDDDIEAAIEADDDTFALTPDDLKADGPGFRFFLREDKLWNWQFFDNEGHVLARSGFGYPGKMDAISAAQDFLRIVAKAA